VAARLASTAPQAIAKALKPPELRAILASADALASAWMRSSVPHAAGMCSTCMATEPGHDCVVQKARENVGLAAEFYSAEEWGSQPLPRKSFHWTLNPEVGQTWTAYNAAKRAAAAQPAAASKRGAYGDRGVRAKRARQA